MRYRLTVAAAVVALSWASARAVPARPGAFTHTQPDGTALTVELMGDEYFHYYRDTDSGQSLRMEADGTLTPFDPQAMSQARERADQRRSSANAARAARLPGMRQQAAGPNRTIGNFGNMTGTKRGLVILVNFADTQMKISQTVFDNQFNQAGFSTANHIGSVSEFFSDQSYGTFNLVFDVVGPVTVSEDLSYYGENDSSDNDKYPGQMVGEAVQLAYSQGLVTDFSPYDWDGDNKVDQVYVIYAGYGEAQGAPASTVWPHQWDLASAKYYGDGPGALTFNGKTVNSYACSNELAGTSGTTINGMGTACHEFSHCLGYPDLYDTDYSGGNGMSYYDIMNSGSYNGKSGIGEQPCGYTSYERWMAGWLQPVELTDPTTVTAMPDLASSPNAFVFYNDNNRNEYFLLENRYNDRWFKYADASSAGKGLMVIHVDYNATAWSNNKPNDDPEHQRFIYVPANKSYTVSTSNFFPAGATSMTSTSHASVYGKYLNTNSSGNYNLENRDITEIAYNNTSHAISFKFNGGGELYTVTLNPGTGSLEGPTTLTQTYSFEALSLPEPTIDVPGWVFISWDTVELPGYVALDDYDDSFLVSSSAFTPDSSLTLYAVYVYEDENGDWTLSSNPVDDANYTLTYSVNGTVTGTWTQTDEQKLTTLPGADPGDAWWTFAGWATTAVAQTTTAPSLREEGESFRPVGNVTLYAVFTHNNEVYISNVANYTGTGTKAPTFYFPHIAHLGRPFAGPKLTCDSDARPAYSSSDESVATVDSITGAVTPVAAGTTVITATFPETATYSEGSASYELRVVE